MKPIHLGYQESQQLQPILFRKMSKSSAQRAIEARKKANAEYDIMDSVISENKRRMQIAKFEISTQKRIENRMKKVARSYDSIFLYLWNDRIE